MCAAWCVCVGGGSVWLVRRSAPPRSAVFPFFSLFLSFHLSFTFSFLFCRVAKRQLKSCAEALNILSSFPADLVLLSGRAPTSKLLPHSLPPCVIVSILLRRTGSGDPRRPTASIVCFFHIGPPGAGLLCPSFLFFRAQWLKIPTPPHRSPLHFAATRFIPPRISVFPARRLWSSVPAAASL